MVEVGALRKHPCPQCGGDAEWNPAKKALACPFCGTLLPPPDDPPTAAIAELDLEAALATTPAHQDPANSGQRSVRCESCQAISVFEATRVAQRCDFCGSPAIVPAAAMPDLITPQSLLPAHIPETQIRDQLHQWYRSRWFAPNRLKTAALTDTVRGIYLPYWTFDAHVNAQWQAEAGYHYFVTEQVQDAKGNTSTRQVRHTRWEPCAGSLEHSFDDELVPGTVGVHTRLLRKVEPFPTLTDLQPYDPAYVRGWTVERYQVDLEQAAATSTQQMEATIYQLCSREVPGDTYRNLEVTPSYHHRTFKHILVPVWLVTYTYGSRSYQVVANGVTGKLAGEHPWSWLKIACAVAAVTLLILLLSALANH